MKWDSVCSLGHQDLVALGGKMFINTSRNEQAKMFTEILF